jgi:hypothetical protein
MKSLDAVKTVQLSKEIFHEEYQTARSLSSSLPQDPAQEEHLKGCLPKRMTQIES